MSWILICLRYCSGVAHGDELLLMFTSNLNPPMTDANDIKASKMLLDLWTPFASDGYYIIYIWFFSIILIDL